MNYEQLMYLKLSEESIEVAKECSKIIQFGADEVYAPLGISNKERLKGELKDLFSVVEILNRNYELGFKFNPEDYKEKEEKILKYARYSVSLGTLRKDDK